jgi:hypothetical protein
MYTQRLEVTQSSRISEILPLCPGYSNVAHSVSKDHDQGQTKDLRRRTSQESCSGKSINLGPFQLY